MPLSNLPSLPAYGRPAALSHQPCPARLGRAGPGWLFGSLALWLSGSLALWLSGSLWLADYMYVANYIPNLHTYLHSYLYSYVGRYSYG